MQNTALDIEKFLRTNKPFSCYTELAMIQTSGSHFLQWSLIAAKKTGHWKTAAEYLHSFIALHAGRKLAKSADLRGSFLEEKRGYKNVVERVN